jgi:hypothetical protein
MEPIRIKYYGLIPITRRGYLITTAVAFVVAGCMLALARVVGRLPPFTWPWEQAQFAAGSGFAPWFFNNFWRIILLLLVLELVDIATVVYRFAQKEAEQRARPPQPQPTNSRR